LEVKMSDISQEDWQAYVEQMEKVFKFLKYAPNRREPELYFPPRIDDTCQERRLTIDWYDDEPGNPGLRFGDKLVFHDFEWPTPLKVRRWLAYAASSAFVPWRHWLGYAKDLWLAAPEEKDIFRALYHWIVDDFFSRLKKINQCSDDELEGALEDLKWMRASVSKIRIWLDDVGTAMDRTVDEIGSIRIALKDRLEQRD